MNISKLTQESKLVLSTNIKKRINYLVNELKNVLMFRYLIEKDLHEIQSKYWLFLYFYRIKNKLVIRNNNLTEELCYLTIWWLMYIFTLLKVPEFDIDKWMRAKLICRIHNVEEKKLGLVKPCCCLYLLQTRNIVNFLTKNYNRLEEIRSELKRHYRYNEKEKKWEIIQENLPDLKKKMKRSYIDEKSVKSIEGCLNITLPVLFD